MNKGMLLYLMTGNPIFMVMNGGGSNQMLMLYLMGAFGSQTSGGLTQLSTTTAGGINPLMLALMASGQRRRRSYRRSRPQTVYIRRR